MKAAFTYTFLHISMTVILSKNMFSQTNHIYFIWQIKFEAELCFVSIFAN